MLPKMYIIKTLCMVLPLLAINNYYQRWGEGYVSGDDIQVIWG